MPDVSETNAESCPEVVVEIQVRHARLCCKERDDYTSQLGQADHHTEPLPNVPTSGGFDTFKHAPPKPHGEPWEILLKRLMDKERLRCDAWKDEVQNLLIFAGLFSAVVTAFIVESYKFLQPDPNDAIVNLLSHIATHLDSPLNSTLINSSSVAQSFFPTPSSIRINIFWFISLVLSLTTVLVGIIALQWLREHQSYPTDLTSRQKYALCVMRANGLETWHVDTIFTSLPLLLQSALVLFLAGVIDFLHAIGHWIVVTPVAIVVGATLIFLIATTILPWLQVFLLYLVSFTNHPSADKETLISLPIYSKAPSQCPYKSPQSRAVRNIWFGLLQLHMRVFYPFRSRLRIARYFPHFSTSRARTEEDISKSHFIRYLSYASEYTSWVDFDFVWLTIRDGYMQSFFKRSSAQNYSRKPEGERFHDLVLGLLDQRYDETLFPSVYHCFSEISELALQPTYYRQNFTNLADFSQQSAYLHDLMGSDGDTLLSSYLVLQAPGDQTDHFLAIANDFSEIASTLTLPLHEQNMEAFISTRSNAASPKWKLKVHLLKYFFKARNISPVAHIRPKVPNCLVLNSFQLWSALNFRKDVKGFPALAEEILDLTRSILQQTEGSFSPDSAVHNEFVQRNILSIFMESSGFCATYALQRGDAQSTIREKYHSIFDHIKQHLAHEMASWLTTPNRPSLFFYTSSLFAHSVVAGPWILTRNHHWVATDIPFRSMCSTIHAYQQRTIDEGIIDPCIQERFQAQERYPSPFSFEWWDELIVHELLEGPTRDLSSPSSSI